MRSIFLNGNLGQMISHSKGLDKGFPLVYWSWGYMAIFGQKTGQKWSKKVKFQKANKCIVLYIIRKVLIRAFHWYIGHGGTWPFWGKNGSKAVKKAKFQMGDIRGFLKELFRV